MILQLVHCATCWGYGRNKNDNLCFHAALASSEFIWLGYSNEFQLPLQENKHLPEMCWPFSRSYANDRDAGLLEAKKEALFPGQPSMVGIPSASASWAFCYSKGAHEYRELGHRVWTKVKTLTLAHQGWPGIGRGALPSLSSSKRGWGPNHGFA